MKKSLLALFFLSFASSAAMTPGDFQVLTKAACSEHASPRECAKYIDKVAAYVKANDDYYMFCQKSKSMGMAVNQNDCDQAEELRNSIEKNAN